MVSNHKDASAEKWLTDRDIDLLRGDGRLAGHGAVEVGPERHTARHAVVATGAEPIIPPVPGLRELDGVWTNREVTGMTAVPRRLLILGGGPVGVEMAQAVRRLGGDVALVDLADHVLANEPAPLGQALGEVLRRDGIELALGVSAEQARRDGTDFVLTVDGGTELRGDRLPSCPVAGLGSTASDSRPSASSPTPRAYRSTRTCVPATASGRRRRDRHLAADNHRQVPGRHCRREHPGRPATGELRGPPPRGLHRPPGGRGRRGPGVLPWLRSGLGRREDCDVHACLRRVDGFLTLLSDGERLTGAYALGPEAGEWLQQATLAIRAHVPLDVLRDTIQPFPTFSEIYTDALGARRAEIAGAQ